MTPTEEAKKLVDEMLHCFQGSIDAYTAKQCALIAVEKLIDESRQQENVFRFKYWREVKKHLDNDIKRSQELEELYPQQ
jgi:polyhydroxyalkanoate synthesis regulator phasin